MSFIYDLFATWDDAGTTYYGFALTISDGDGGEPVAGSESRAINIVNVDESVFSVDQYGAIRFGADQYTIGAEDGFVFFTEAGGYIFDAAIVIAENGLNFGDGTGAVINKDDDNNIIIEDASGTIVGCDLFVGYKDTTNPTNMTEGFLFTPRTAGSPVDTPAVDSDSACATVVDTVNDKLWFYYGAAWHFIDIT